MDPKFIDNHNLKEIQKLKREIESLENEIREMEDKIQSIYCSCNHIFQETTVMRVCQKCGYSESTYY